MITKLKLLLLSAAAFPKLNFLIVMLAINFSVVYKYSLAAKKTPIYLAIDQVNVFSRYKILYSFLWFSSVLSLFCTCGIPFYEQHFLFTFTLKVMNS